MRRLRLLLIYIVLVQILPTDAFLCGTETETAKLRRLSLDCAPVPPDLDPSMIDTNGFLTRLAASMTVRYAPVEDGFDQLAKKMRDIDGSAKLNQLRERTLGEDVILPSPNRFKDKEFCLLNLARLIIASWTPYEPGDTKVVYTLPSTGKTTALARLVTNAGSTFSELDDSKKPRRLMFTNYAGDIPYVSSMAKALDIDDDDVAAYVLKALEKTDKTSPASILVLDEMNTPREKDCNIFFVSN